MNRRTVQLLEAVILHLREREARAGTISKRRDGNYQKGPDGIWRKLPKTAPGVGDSTIPTTKAERKKDLETARRMSMSGDPGAAEAAIELFARHGISYTPAHLRRPKLSAV